MPRKQKAEQTKEKNLQVPRRRQMTKIFFKEDRSPVNTRDAK